MEKKYILSETQVRKVVTEVIKEQGLYGNPSDVVDYDLPEYLSDVIILRKLESMGDVQNSVKELHKRVMRLEKGLDTAGSHQKAYGTGTDYSEKNKKSKDIEDRFNSDERDDELQKDIDALQKIIKKTETDVKG